MPVSVTSGPRPFLKLGPVLWAAAVLATIGAAEAQDFLGSGAPHAFELSDAVRVAQADGAVVTDLDRARALLADHQDSDAVEIVRRVMESSGGQLLPVSKTRYVTVGDYCHRLVSRFPPAALALYRSRVDPQAKRWYDEGLQALNAELLQRVVSQAFCSSWGDDALLALGELALEAGDYAGARGNWEKILPLTQESGGDEAAAPWLAYPDSAISPAAVRARLVLTSILEGSTTRAREELDQFARLHPQARGRLGGQEVDLAQALGKLLDESRKWLVPPASPDWTTFAGQPQRNQHAATDVDPGRVAWRLPLESPVEKQGAVARDLIPAWTRGPLVADDRAAPLAYFPVVVGRLVLVASRSAVWAVDLVTGKPAWDASQALIYREGVEGAAPAGEPLDLLGLPRQTVTLADGKLYARLGSPVTAWPQTSLSGVRPGALVCLDLATQGRLLWKIEPEEGWAFEGAPLAADGDVYVALRRNDIRPQAHVACLDSRSGTQRWRRFVAAAESPARGILHETTHNLLTLEGQTLYYNTNLGAVAALDRHAGAIHWVSLYPRARQGDLARLAPHWQRQLTPCLYYRGMLLVAPLDSPRIFAFDAASGYLLWQTDAQTGEVVHLLGALGDQLIASGRRLMWIGLSGAAAGKVVRRWPEGDPPPAYGRGMLSADHIYWPTRDKIYVFDLKSALPVRAIDLAPRRTSGGNLVIAGGRLLIATDDELVTLDERVGPPPERKSRGVFLSQRAPPAGSWGMLDSGFRLDSTLTPGN